jgi:hypothetical protein
MEKLVEDEKIAGLIEAKDHVILAKILGARFCEFTEDDEKYIDMFWEPAFNKSWIYISDEVVADQFGYKRGRSMMSHFYRKLGEDFEENIDYKFIAGDDKIIDFYSPKNLSKDSRGGALKKHVLVTGETFKYLLQSAHTAQGKQVRKYFLRVESLGHMVTELCYMYRDILSKARDEEMAKLKRKQLALESFVTNIKQLEKKQVFYIATTPSYCRQNRFKFGGVKEYKDLKSRLVSYNTGHAEGDSMYYVKAYRCNDYRQVEERIGNVLKQFKDKANSRKEMLHIRFEFLAEIAELIIDNYDKEIDWINAHCQKIFSDTIEGEAVVIPEFDIKSICDEDETIKVTVKRHGNQTEHKINISNWTDVQIHDTFRKIISLCAIEQKIEYEFDAHKDSMKLELTWKEMVVYFKTYAGLNLLEWRQKFKDWMKKEKPSRLVVRGVKIA